MRKRIFISFLICMTIIISPVTTLKTSAAWNPPTTPTCNAVYLINDDTGTVVYEKNQDQKIYPASITKLMTAILVCEKYKGNLKQVVTVKNTDLMPLNGTGGSLVPLKNNEQLTVEQLLNCLLIKSGDDSAMVLARAAGGTVENFVEQMNAKAKSIGLKNTHYANPHGLHDTEQYTTAIDVYKLAKYAMGIDEISKIVATYEYDMDATNKSAKRVLYNTNWLMSGARPKFYYKWVKGIKTGTTTPAGACLVSYAEKDGKTYYCVTMGGAKKTVNGVITNTAFSETKSLYEWVFSNFQIQPVIKTTDRCDQVAVELSNTTKILLYPDTQINALVSSTFKSSDVEIKTHVPKTIKAPINKGQKIGTADIILTDSKTNAKKKIGTVNLIAGDSAARSQSLYILSLISGFFNSKWFKIVAVLLVVILLLYICGSVYYNRRKKTSRKRGRIKYKGMK